MEKKFRVDIRPMRGTFYFVLAAALLSFGLLYLFVSKPLADGLPVFLWCIVCGGLIGWRALANLTGSEDMREIGKPAVAGLLTFVGGGRALMALAHARIDIVQRHGWILWLVGALVFGASAFVFARVRATTSPRPSDSAAGRGWQP
jgi:hypothetical protein